MIEPPKAQGKTAYLLLSSGRRQRYLEDIYRALALPEGAEIRFRYWDNLLSESAAVDFLNTSGSIAYLAYLDIATEGVPPTFVPVRRAEISSVEKHGSSFFIHMRVREHVSTDAGAELSRLAIDDLPVWGDRDSSGQYRRAGYLVSRLQEDIDASFLAPASDGEAFENTVDELLTHADFGNVENQFFYRIEGLKEFNQEHKIKGELMPLQDGFWQLRANRRYRLEISYLYSDKGRGVDRPSHWIGVRTSGIGASIDGSVRQRSDSAYDIKFFHFTALNVPIGAYDEIQVFRTLDPDEPQGLSADIRLGIHTKQSGLALTAKVLIVAAAIALPVVASELSKGSSYWVVAIVGAAIISSFMAIFGLKKPI